MGGDITRNMYSSYADINKLYIVTSSGPGSSRSLAWIAGPNPAGDMDISVGIATDYGLEGPGSNPGGDEIFRPFRPALEPTQPPVKWVPGLPRG